ncbi:MAG: hypothetical protein NT159_07620 [Proteobacteria bacterium]|nr:hypothetical protein [Pseudomonadota bacterium]
MTGAVKTASRNAPKGTEAEANLSAATGAAVKATGASAAKLKKVA